jgi:hypothetical protein
MINSFLFHGKCYEILCFPMFIPFVCSDFVNFERFFCLGFLEKKPGGEGGGGGLRSLTSGYVSWLVTEKIVRK